MNLKIAGTLILTALAAVAIPLTVQAQKTQTQIGNFSNSRVITISGEVTKLLDDKFILNDGTGQIIVEAEPNWGQPMNLSVGDKITVVGRYDDNDFEAITITNTNGEMIPIYDN